MNTFSDPPMVSKNVPHFCGASKAFRYGGPDFLRDSLVP